MTKPGSLRALDGRSGDGLWNYDKLDGAGLDGPTVLGDLTGDHLPELGIATRTAGDVTGGPASAYRNGHVSVLDARTGHVLVDLDQQGILPSSHGTFVTYSTTISGASSQAQFTGRTLTRAMRSATVRNARPIDPNDIASVSVTDTGSVGAGAHAYAVTFTGQQGGRRNIGIAGDLRRTWALPTTFLALHARIDRAGDDAVGIGQLSRSTTRVLGLSGSGRQIYATCLPLRVTAFAPTTETAPRLLAAVDQQGVIVGFDARTGRTLWSWSPQRGTQTGAPGC
ncbi:MAG: hypothetical protein ABR549_05755 [Mycobacteriales bacterium]